MAVSKKDRKRSLKRALRVRKKLKDKSDSLLPRVSIFRSLQHIYAQVINDVDGTTLVSSSTLQIDVAGDKKMKARAVGRELATRAQEKGITAVRIDRGSRRYHGRVQELVEGMRESGIRV